ncbi:uncharacterized protein MELLADRAFT_92735 [Melampsora larici-populina 98AG31]|uniref:CxC5 like cysteine cluster associated with KDZ domain-containing protein n=1 Tax=Melampsora larici-populina (strain 98AG31 / pathotype 3-4-7) TaxID=747676 RepID=F4S2X1_MELLP|nr:uncharacterized protein MELLADRAFT_92735 [Melampsora larici-populina 98AG31]EGG01018.1 hypothetical protein MELLADRAFT_92735 [Melampsora larici-populina 98AG31]
MVLYRHPVGGRMVVPRLCTASSTPRLLQPETPSSPLMVNPFDFRTNMLVTEFTSRLEAEHPQLARHLTLANLVKFVNLASEVYHRADHALNFTSADTRVLPFLSLALQLDLDMDEYEAIWNLTFPSVPFAHINPANLIRLHGLEVKLPTKIHEVYLTPPTSICLVCDQPSGRPLEIRPRRLGYVYDLDGIHSAEFYTCSCLDCRATYRPSYYTTDETRVYYTKAQGAHPDHYQVHCHFGMTYRLAMSFRQLQMLAHAHGDNTDRLLPAMIRELHYIANNGALHRDHFCSLCVRTYPIEHEGKETVKIIREVVTDGLTIGHWRCTASSAQLQALAHRAGAPPPDGPCLNALPKVTSRFCAEHEETLKGWCVAQPCTKLAEPGSETCKSQKHKEALTAFQALKKKNFSLKSMLNRPGSHLPSDPSVHLHPDTAELIDFDALHQANEADREHEAACDGGAAKPKGTPVLSRSRTHNDQLIVGACGIILSWCTFYNAEAPSALRDYLVEAFPDGLPEVIFYDNACNLLRVIHNGDKDPTPFENTVIPVDPFHHRSHKESNSFCQMYTDPKKFPDL